LGIVGNDKTVKNTWIVKRWFLSPS